MARILIRTKDGNSYTMDKGLYEIDKDHFDNYFARKGFSVVPEEEIRRYENTKRIIDPTDDYGVDQSFERKEEYSRKIKEIGLEAEIAEIENRLSPDYRYGRESVEAFESVMLERDIEDIKVAIRAEAAKANNANSIFIEQQKEIAEKEARMAELKAKLSATTHEVNIKLIQAKTEEEVTQLNWELNAIGDDISNLQADINRKAINMERYERDMLAKREEIKKKIEEKQAELAKAEARQKEIKENQENGYKNSEERIKDQQSLDEKKSELAKLKAPKEQEAPAPEEILPTPKPQPQPGDRLVRVVRKLANGAVAIGEFTKFVFTKVKNFLVKVWENRDYGAYEIEQAYLAKQRALEEETMPSVPVVEDELGMPVAPVAEDELGMPAPRAR